MLLVYCIWKYLCTNVYPTQTNSIHSAFRSLVFLIILKDFILLYYIIQSGRDMTQTAVMDFYLLTIIYTLESVTKTFIWFMLIFIAFGWGVYRQYLNSAEIKKTIFIFILIYFIFCLDQILDSFFNSHLAFNLDFKEIKNILFLLMVVVLIYYLAYKSIKRLKWKLYEVSLLSLDYVPSLLLKIKMLRVHSYLCMVYYLMYVLVMILTKTVWFKYMNLNLLLVIMSSVSDIGFLLFM